MTLCPWARHFTHLPRGECPCTYYKLLWIRASAKCKCKYVRHWYSDNVMRAIGFVSSVFNNHIANDKSPHSTGRFIITRPLLLQVHSSIDIDATVKRHLTLWFPETKWYSHPTQWPVRTLWEHLTPENPPFRPQTTASLYPPPKPLTELDY